MGGFTSITGDETIMNADNASFDGTSRGGKMISNGQLWIGSSVAPHVRLGQLTSTGATVSIGLGNGTINLEAGASVPTTFDAESGSAAPVANVLNVFGQNAGSVDVASTNASGNTLNVENRTWGTQYVVDASSTTGLRGTFTTIQAAINQAVADGSPTSIKTIFIRRGTYIENLVMPAASIHLCAYTPVGNLANVNTSFIDVAIAGNITFTAGAVAHFTNLFLATIDATTTVSITTGINSCSFCHCLFNTGGTSNISLTSTVTSGLKLDHCSVVGGNVATSQGDIEIYNSTISSLALTTTGIVVATQSEFITATSTLADTSQATFNFCEFSTASSTALTVGAGCTANVYNTIINSSAANVIDGSGTLNHSGLSFVNGSQNIATTTQNVKPSSAIVPRTAVASSPYVVLSTDYFISVDTTSARTIQLPNAPSTNQVFTVKDRTGGALLNNITVTTVGGVVNIDGSTSYVINVNFGSAQFIFNGTTYEIF